MSPPIRNVIGIDDAPADAEDRVTVVGVKLTGARLDGIVTGTATRDGTDATDAIAEMIERSRFDPKLVLLDGIAIGGFNIIDIHALHARLGRAVIVVARREPDLEGMRAALFAAFPDAAARWALIEAGGPMERAGNVFIQRAGIELPDARRVVLEQAIHGNIPEPLRIAHLVAGAIGTGHSRGRA